MKDIRTGKKLKREVMEGTKDRRKQDFKEKKLQSEIPTGYTDEDREWLKCNTDPRKTPTVFNLKEQMVEAKV